ncbi:hypothetical protein IFR05_001998 [Cadophora sp. M221]|nr:hypothetical protein IFR05_001998 [Cadophora sp. M221]
MVRRTRACQACHSRRMRCDETLPNCTQCLRAGRKCPGPIEGPMIVDVTAQTELRARSRPGSSLRRSGNSSTAATTIPSPISPSQIPSLVQNFFSHFLDYFSSRSGGAPGKFWLHELPYMSSPSATSGLELAVQAVSTVFCANAASNAEYYAGSRAMYGQALQTHSRSVAALQDSAAPTAQMLCTTLILGFYEAMSSTQNGGEGYVRHVEGAAKMVEVLGPEGCGDGLVNELFFTARTQMLLISFLTQQPSIYATAPYLNIPHLSGSKPVHERLLDIMTLLVEELHHPSRHQPNHPMRGPAFMSTVDSRINDLWTEFHATYYQPLFSLSEPGIGEATHNNNINRDDNYPNAFTAYITSYFSLARIFFYTIIVQQNSLCSPSSSTQIQAQTQDKYHTRSQGHDEVMRKEATSIFSCAAYLETQNLGCGFVREVFPLLVVGMHGVEEDRRAARGVLERWRERGVVAGLVGLVIGRLDDLESGR